MNARWRTSTPTRSGVLAACLLALALAASRPAGQAPSSALQLIARDQRQSVAIQVVGSQEMVGLDELAGVFQLDVRDERGAVTVGFRGRTVVLTPDQTIASVSGRLISLSAAPVRTGTRWLVPLDFVTRALAPIYDQRIELRRSSRLVLIGDVRVPRVTIRQDAAAPAVRVTLDVVPAATVAVTQQGSRLLVRVDADALDATVPSFQPGGLLQAIRLADATNIALDLGPRFATFRSTTAPLDGGSRVTIDIAGNADAPTSTGPPPPTPVDPSVPALLAPQAVGIRTVTLDPGHGGDDTGARAADGTLEKDVTLAVARRLKAVLEARLGVRVVMTRDDDRMVPVEQRSAAANNNKADLFLSLHANASFRPELSGAAVYVASFSEADLALEGLAPERLPVFGGGLRTIELVPWSLAQIPHRAESERFAQAIVGTMAGRVPLALRPVEHAPLRVLESANMPAALVEMGYLTNAEQAAALTAPALQGAIAQALLDAVVRMREAGGPAQGAAP
ncbi:MAG: N-acetylmuramoyl-L-alanine amidase [Vicinamibacterales bacterium]